MNDHKDFNKLSKCFVKEKSQNSRNALNPARRLQKSLGNHSATSTAATVQTHFDGIEEVFVNLCNKHEVVVGAVAWLTNVPILSALSGAERVAIIVQKEDFLRNDIGYASPAQQKETTRQLYQKLKCFESGDFIETYPGQQESHPQYNATVQGWLLNNRGAYYSNDEAVRCIGFAPNPKKRANPRMHHKFLVFGDMYEGIVMWPKCIVTGSFNLTHNAVKSRENIVVIEDSAICQSYLSEWAQLWAMSEPLDWSAREPEIDEMYIGT